MPELVDGGDLRQVAPRGAEPVPAGRDERGILHPARFARVRRRVDEGEDLVRVRPVPRGEVREREAHRAELALRLDAVAGRVEDRDAHAAEDLLVDLPLVPRGPGKVMDVLLDVALDPTAPLRRRIDRRPGRAEDEALRHIERHVVRAEVGVELAEVMEREVGPACLRPVGLEARDLRKPLPHHVERAPVARPFHDRGELVVPDHVDLDLLARLDVAGEGNARVGLVVVARAVELRAGPEIGRGAPGVAQGEAADVDRPPVGDPPRAARVDGRAPQPGGALVLEGVQIRGA